MNEEKRKNEASAHSNNTGAYILIAIGAIFLLVNFFEISFSRLWPLVLVAVGVYLLVTRRDGSAARTGHFSAPVDEATSADVEIHLSVGEAKVNPLASADTLIEADLTYVGDIQFDVSGTAMRTVRLRQTSDSNWTWLNPATWFNGSDRYDWNIGLNPDVPMRLNIHGGMGTARLNLRDLQVTDLRLHGGVGEVHAVLPASDTGYQARVEGGMGETRLEVPAHTSTMLEIRGGVGQVDVDIDSRTEVRVQAKGGIGSVSVPSRLTRISGGGGDFELGDSGIWETAGFEQAEHRVVINYEGGVGELRIR